MKWQMVSGLAAAPSRSVLSLSSPVVYSITDDPPPVNPFFQIRFRQNDQIMGAACPTSLCILPIDFFAGGVYNGNSGQSRLRAAGPKNIKIKSPISRANF